MGNTFNLKACCPRYGRFPQGSIKYMYRKHTKSQLSLSSMHYINLKKAVHQINCDPTFISLHNILHSFNRREFTWLKMSIAQSSESLDFEGWEGFSTLSPLLVFQACNDKDNSPDCNARKNRKTVHIYMGSPKTCWWCMFGNKSCTLITSTVDHLSYAK